MQKQSKLIYNHNTHIIEKEDIKRKSVMPIITGLITFIPVLSAVLQALTVYQYGNFYQLPYYYFSYIVEYKFILVKVFFNISPLIIMVALYYIIFKKIKDDLCKLLLHACLLIIYFGFFFGKQLETIIATIDYFKFIYFNNKIIRFLLHEKNKIYLIYAIIIAIILLIQYVLFITSNKKKNIRYKIFKYISSILHIFVGSTFFLISIIFVYINSSEMPQAKTIYPMITYNNMYFAIISENEEFYLVAPCQMTAEYEFGLEFKLNNNELSLTPDQPYNNSSPITYIDTRGYLFLNKDGVKACKIDFGLVKINAEELVNIQFIN